MATPRSYKRTNVRFLLTLIASAAAAGCAQPTSLRHSAAPTCDDTSVLVCERFAAQKRCACEPQREIDALLTTFGAPARL